MSSIAKYTEFIDSQDYDEYISDMEIYKILHPEADIKIDFIVDKADETILQRRYIPPDR